MQRVLVTGGAGFVGSQLVRRLVADGIETVIYDNLSTGRLEFVEGSVAGGGASLVTGDILDDEALHLAMRGCDAVFHLAANADVRHGFDEPRRDLERNTIGTANVLEGMRAAGVRRIAFTSTGSVYGEPDLHPTPESCPFPVQTSLYAASKLAGEAMIQAYCSGYGFAGASLRLVSVLGEHYTHGHVIDFYRMLSEDQERLTILGDGRQRKSYVYVADCVDAIVLALAAQDHGRAEAYNVGTDDTLTPDDSAAIIAEHLGASPTIEHTGGERGWLGDSPFILLDAAKLRGLGWAPTLTIRQALQRTLEWFDRTPFVLSEPVRR